MDHRSITDQSSGRFSLALYGAAVTVAIAAASVAGLSAFHPKADQEALLTVTTMRSIGPDRIAGLIEPVAPPAVVAAAPVAALPEAKPVPAPHAVETVAALPPKPLPRPCIECKAPVATARAIPAPAVAAVDPIDQEFDVASIAPDGPIPPQPVGPQAGEGAGPGLLIRSGQAVVAGSGQIVGTAWDLSGQAVGGIVRGVRALTF